MFGYVTVVPVVFFFAQIWGLKLKVTFRAWDTFFNFSIWYSIWMYLIQFVLNLCRYLFDCDMKKLLNFMSESYMFLIQLMDDFLSILICWQFWSYVRSCYGSVYRMKPGGFNPFNKNVCFVWTCKSLGFNKITTKTGPKEKHNHLQPNSSSSKFKNFTNQTLLKLLSQTNPKMFSFTHSKKNCWLNFPEHFTWNCSSYLSCFVFFLPKISQFHRSSPRRWSVRCSPRRAMASAWPAVKSFCPLPRDSSVPWRCHLAMGFLV